MHTTINTTGMKNHPMHGWGAYIQVHNENILRERGEKNDYF